MIETENNRDNQDVNLPNLNNIFLQTKSIEWDLKEFDKIKEYKTYFPQYNYKEIL